jgi:hypothetical protein
MLFLKELITKITLVNLANTTENWQIFAILAIIAGVLWMALDAIRGMKRAGKKD